MKGRRRWIFFRVCIVVVRRVEDFQFLRSLLVGETARREEQRIEVLFIRYKIKKNDRVWDEEWKKYSRAPLLLTSVQDSFAMTTMDHRCSHAFG